MSFETITKAPSAVRCIDFGGSSISVGTNGVTAIEPYDEFGQMSYVPWFNVWKDHVLDCKVNAAHVQTVYYVRKGRHE